MLKILIINTVGLKLEGITNSILTYLGAMDRSDMEIDFVLFDQNFHPEIFETIKQVSRDLYVLPKRKRNTFRYFVALYRLIRKNQYHIVHAHGNSSTLALEMWAAKLAGCRVRIAHSRNTCTDYPVLDMLLRPLFKISYTQAFACGTDAGRWLFGRNNFTVIPNGKDISKFAFNYNKRVEYREQLNLTDQIVIGHAGNFNHQKNHEFLIQVFKELIDQDKRYVLYLMGDGIFRPQIEKMVEAYGLKQHVVFTGSISNMSDFLQAMDIMVFPSRFEGLPNVVLEWQIACLPSVISDVITKECRLTDLVYYMPLEEGPSAWAAKIRSIQIVNRAELRESTLKKIHAAGFDIQQNARQLKQMYYGLLPFNTEDMTSRMKPSGK